VSRTACLVAALVVSAACRSAPTERVTAFTGATIYDGTGADPIADAVLVVRDGRISRVGPSGEVDVPSDANRVDVQGRFIVPGLINTHGHVGDTEGLEGGRYSEENVLRQLALYARYGITTVVSLGGDGPAGISVRDRQDSMTVPRARLFVAGPVVTGSHPDSVRAQVDRNAAMGVDFIKIRVDDNLGATDKMPPAAYRTVIEAAHAHSLPVATHVFYASDTKALLEAGTDFVAHSVRDVPMDEELTSSMRTREVCYTPTLTREVSTFVYESEPTFFADSFFLRDVDPATLDALRDPAVRASVRESRSAQQYKLALQVAMENLRRARDAGVTIALGTDSGPPRRFQGYFEHLEMEMMADAGLPAREILLAATGSAATCMGLDDLGTLEPGNWADLIVLDADPLNDVTNLRRIESVWIGGSPVER